MRMNLLKVCLGNRVYRLLRPYLRTLNQRRYWHIKQGGKVLLVAHIDTVRKPRFHGLLHDRIYAAGLDDRLGVCLALDLAQERDDVDVLITDDEEAGQSTASLVPFSDLQEYNAVLGLDRGGMDFVDYGLGGKDLVRAYSEYAPHDLGSFSDICFLDNPPCGCINVGVGYQDAHDHYSWVRTADIRQTRRNLRAFLEQYSGTRFPAPAPMDGFWASNGFAVYPQGRTCFYCGVELYQWEPDDCCENCDQCMQEGLRS